MSDENVARANHIMPATNVKLDHNYSIEEDQSQHWQKVEAKTKKRSNGVLSEQYKKRYRTENNGTIQLSNSFQSLENDNDMDEISEPRKEPKPPPIFIPRVANVVNMMQALQSMVSLNEFSYKCLSGDKIKIFPNNADAYRMIVKGLTNVKLCFHTYQLKQERAYRVVLKNMHHSTPVDSIKEAIEEQGHSVRNIINVMNNKTKVPLSLFFVDLEPNSNNKMIFDIIYLLNAKIKFEPPHKKKEIVQCKR